ncbi:glycosyltransferase family 4 protein [Methylomonas sp. SURF-2]|uniref:Glycosyltransferase family 4 protein n=1 Tax=Methylomonas subterranea TaxID=2952225 RepID=A0ABT1TJ50_9GAMM|nr:glycosyltransferase family 4 protein [Methylomonas sp. SURF-2]MCQ8105488.1 glycosyltransferase family 4 protein [Methylomonas sp. SURF-2]
MATGNGAYVVHKTLESELKNYRVIPYNPFLTLMPPVLYGLGRLSKARLIHTTPDYGLFHVRRKIPVILTFHNYVLDVFMKDYSNFLQNTHYQTDLKWFTRLSVNNASVITAVSEFTAKLVSNELAIDNVKVIYNGINHNVFYPDRFRNRSDNEIKVLFCGNLTSRKGVQWLLPIVSRLSPKITVFYTSGLRSKTKLPENSSMQCLGSIDYADMPAVYNEMDILLFPTVREGLSLAAIEAMACGLPIVTTYCSSLPELVDDGKGGFLCPLGDVHTFADRINRLADDALLRRDMGEYNRERVEKTFTLVRMVKEYKLLFDEALDTAN